MGSFFTNHFFKVKKTATYEEGECNFKYAPTWRMILVSKRLVTPCNPYLQAIFFYAISKGNNP